jgi:hypothetical protein
MNNPAITIAVPMMATPSHTLNQSWEDIYDAGDDAEDRALEVIEWCMLITVVALVIAAISIFVSK